MSQRRPPAYYSKHSDGSWGRWCRWNRQARLMHRDFRAQTAYIDRLFESMMKREDGGPVHVC